MAITLPTAPPDDVPVPVTDCLRWCLQPAAADVFTTPGGPALIEVDFTTSSPVANGTTFILWGITFTVDDTVPFTGNTFDLNTSDQTAAENFAQMLAANLFFNLATNVALADDTLVEITWKDCGAQPRFSGSAYMEYAALTGAGVTVTVTNGTTPELVDGYALVARLAMEPFPNAGTGYPVTLLEALPMQGGCSSVAPVCVDYMPDARTLLHTPMPTLNYANHPGSQPSMMRAFYINFGWYYRENCVPVSGTIASDGPVYVVNTALGVEHVEGMEVYYPDDPLTTRAEFLTTSPDYWPLCTDSFNYLWFLNRLGYTGPLRSVIVAKLKDDTTPFAFGTWSVGSADAYVYGINASPTWVAAALGVDVTELDYYSVAVQWDVAGNWEYLTVNKFFRVDSCCDQEELYFLCSAGGIATMPADNLEEVEISQSANEVNLTVPCTTDRVYRAKYGGRSLSNVRSTKGMSFKMKLGKEVSEVKFLQDFKASPQRWVRVRGTDGLYYAAKFNLDLGSVKIFKYDEAIEVVMSGTLALDLPIQASVEPNA